ncbi:hypothetical protein PG994_013970 [Apiospora phragmitis]|uniref:Uncharacterized protein n=1 Tax=Apiospora phragmitis TaxID=2905665 RepID=A0ABR1T2Z9_9PEZI
MLLDNGAKPAQRWQGRTIWERALIWQHQYFIGLDSGHVTFDVASLARIRLRIMKRILDPRARAAITSSPIEVDGMALMGSLDACFGNYDAVLLQEVKDLIIPTMKNERRKFLWRGIGGTAYRS